MFKSKMITPKVIAALPAFGKTLSDLLPSSLKNVLISKVLNRLFVTACQQGELNFLKEKIVLIEVSDFEFQFSLSLVEQKLLVNSVVAAPDLRVKASSEDFFLLCSAKVDPDTLFFQRRLSMLGDTELGLYLKNFLDSFDTTTHLPSSLLSVQQYIATELLKRRDYTQDT